MFHRIWWRRFCFLCRYGDLCPKSAPAKVFAMVWFVVGIVIFSVFMGALASLLTVTTVKQTIGSPSGTDTKTVNKLESNLVLSTGLIM